MDLDGVSGFRRSCYQLSLFINTEPKVGIMLLGVLMLGDSLSHFFSLWLLMFLVGGFVGADGLVLIEHYDVARRTLLCHLLLVNDSYSFPFLFKRINFVILALSLELLGGFQA